MNLRIVSRIVIFGLIFALLAPAAELLAAKKKQAPVKIGVLVSLTGSWSSLGINTVAALQVAAADLNNIRPQFRPARFRFLVRDTQLDPSRALDAIMELDQQGVQIVIGPQSSAEVAMIKPYADAHNMLVISQGSTASSLAIAGDNILRFCPNDTREAEAIVALLQHDGIQAIVPLWRNDAGNNGLHDSVQIRFQALGGTVAPGFRYEPTTTDFSTADSAIASQITNLIAGGINPSSIAVYLAAFDEVVGVFDLAWNYPALVSTAFYGSDGVALSAALLSDPLASAFAIHSGYPNPIFGLPDALRDRWQPVADAIEARTGITPDAFALSAYDALFVVQLALQHPKAQKSFEKFKTTFLDEAGHYNGVTGSTALDAAGDRENGDFDFWAVRLNGAAPAWRRIGSYSNGVITLF